MKEVKAVFESDVQFFQYDEGALDRFDEDVGRLKSVKYQQLAIKYGRYIIGFIILCAIFYQYLKTLGTEKDSSLAYQSYSYLEYDIADIPRILPLHHLSYFQTDDILNRMKCNIYKDEKECLLYNKKKCLTLGEKT